jgi:hypothetical protein
MGASQSGLSQKDLETQLARYAKKVDIPDTSNYAKTSDLIEFAKKSELPDIDTKLSSGFGIKSDSAIEFGKDITDKEPSAGKIVYGGWDRPNHLGIVGAGKPGETRKVKIWDELEVDNINTANAKINGKTVATVDQLPDLTPYVKTSDLSGFAKTSDLSGFAKTSDLSGFAKTSDLSSDLALYAKTAEVDTKLASYAKLTDVDTKLSSGFGIKDKNVLEFGQGIADKEGNAGKIFYGGFDRPNHLGIIGAGKPGETRKVKIWDELEVDNINTANAKINGKNVATVDQLPNLTPYAKTSDLAPYAKTAEVDTKLAPYAKTSDLAPYAKTADVDTKLSSGFGIKDKNVLEFGQGIADKEGNAGKIFYGGFDRPNHLGIVGAGKPGETRKVKIWDELEVDNINTASAKINGKNVATVDDLNNYTKINQPVTIRDQFHGIKYRASEDGPFVHGWAGGALGTAQRDGEKTALSWDRENNVSINGKLNVAGKNVVTTDQLPDLAPYAKTAEVDTKLSSGFGIKDKNVLEFGQGIADKEGNAGKIFYGGFDRPNHLGIVGAGKPGEIRKVKIWDELEVDNINTASAKINGKTVATVDDLAPYIKYDEWGSALINNSNLILGQNQDKNRFLLHAPNDDRKSLWIAPINDAKNGWVWDNSVKFTNIGTFEVKNLNVRDGKIEFGSKYHGMKYRSTEDGPFVHGWAGGALGTVQDGSEKLALSWDRNNNVDIKGNLNIKGTATVNGQPLANDVSNVLKNDAAFRASVKGDKGDSGTMTNNTGFDVNMDNAIEFGKGIDNKEINAGKIRYGVWGNALNIVGAGTQADINARKVNRLVQIYDSLNITNGADSKGTTHFNYDGTNVNYIRGDTVLDAGGLQTRQGYGFGPYIVRFYNKDGGNRCLDAGQMGNDNMGTMNCAPGNAWQQFYFNPVTGYLKNAATGKCLDTFDGTWRFNDCNGHQNQRFWRWENQIRSRNGNCLDIGNKNQNAGCDGNNANQLMKFDEI